MNCMHIINFIQAYVINETIGNQEATIHNQFVNDISTSTSIQVVIYINNFCNNSITILWKLHLIKNHNLRIIICKLDCNQIQIKLNCKGAFSVVTETLIYIIKVNTLKHIQWVYSRKHKVSVINQASPCKPYNKKSSSNKCILSFK